VTVEVKVPVLAESIPDATLLEWKKKPGEKVDRDELLIEVETDKVVLEVVAPESGVLEEIVKGDGETVHSDEVIARISEGAGAPAEEKEEKEGDEAKAAEEETARAEEKAGEKADGEKAAGEKAAGEKAAGEKAERKAEEKADKGREPEEGEQAAEPAEEKLSPAVRKLVAEHDLDPARIEGTGPGGRITKEDVLAHLDKGEAEQAERAQAPEAEEEEKEKEREREKEKEKPAPPAEAKAARPAAAEAPAEAAEGERREWREPMSRLRQRIAERLVEAQRTAAILTTFNEIDMQPVMALRKRYRDRFEKAHGVRLGFMSFFTKASVAALKRFPAVNAYIEGAEVVYHDYHDIGIAVGSPRGLVVPILRDAERLSFAEIEQRINDFGERAKKGTLGVDELTGGTFTITNGGVFGSLLSTPILNPPQTAILGMHKIEDRAVVEDGQVVVRPMMYVALSYDHRLIDGREAVQFLVTIKEALEDPTRMLLEI